MIRIENLTGLNLGVQGENLSKTIEIDMSAWTAEWPDATFCVMHKRWSENIPYAVGVVGPDKPTDGALEFANNILKWHVPATDTAVSGRGWVEIRASQYGALAKSITVPAHVLPGIVETDELDPPEQLWLDRLERTAEQAEQAASQAESTVQRVEPRIANLEASSENLHNRLYSITEEVESRPKRDSMEYTAFMDVGYYGGVIGAEATTHYNIFSFPCVAGDTYRIVASNTYTVDKFVVQPAVGAKYAERLTTVSKTDAPKGYDFVPDYTGWVALRCQLSTTNVSVEHIYTDTVFTAIDLVARKGGSSVLLAESEGFTESRDFEITNDGSGMNIIVSCDAYYSGEAPHVYAVYPKYGSTMAYPLTGKRQEWRLPPMQDTDEITLRMDVPSGTTVYINRLGYRYDNSVRHGAIQYHSHFGVHAPSQTVNAAINAAKLGFNSFIMVPQHTADGVLVCCHDPEFKGVTIADKTLLELKAIDYNGDVIATVDEIFEVCAKTGMKPMFSTHSNRSYGILSETEWRDVRRMLEKYGILSWMQVKAAPPAAADMNDPEKSVFAGAYNVLGADIDSYTLDYNNGSPTMTSNGLAHIKALNWYSPLICKIQYFDPETVTTGHLLTEEFVAPAKAEGLTISVANDSTRTVERMRELIEMGITEFTEDVFYSFGLNY